ncbi:HlyD family secretion protein [Flavobacterium haoranii]|uniref:Membrane fusion protein, multidrug efflux system n=1 Tax=Flavobacterium haoranii TaxID=683124 RepID=A0A1M6KTW2_9FLAO|nr:HlyD family secretion protein [Flavobacterium haoranii]SHJ62458.1 membrane fusion protein, multidrug efflux system [Flavobacterium haoranii]
MEKKKETNKKFTIILIVLVALGVVYGGYKYFHSQAHETTDDAQIEQNMAPIIPRVSGYIKKIYVTDNQNVKKGDTLFTIDNIDYLVKVEEAQAALVAAQGSFEVSKADVGSANANVSVYDANAKTAYSSIENAKVKLWRAQNDFERFEKLYANKSITKQQYEQALAAKQVAENELKALQQQKAAADYQKNVSVTKTSVANKQTTVAEANIKRAQAQLDAAKLNLGYTVVTAAVDGQVSTIDLQPGQMVQAGQSLFYIINSSDVWVVANFKETQLNKMRLGQEVEIKVDAYPDYTFVGEITSFSPATGSRFSLLPPDNATGNFVKTIQRLPVKISLKNTNDKEKVSLLRAGMNVDVDVHLK